MPRTGLAYADVADAIHDLDKAGLTPSIRLIREKLGKGSLSTIAEHKRAFDAKQASGPGPALPDPIAKQLVAGAEAYWQELVEAAEADVTAAQEAAAAKVNAVSEDLESAREELASLRDALGARDSRIDALEKAAEAQEDVKAELVETVQAKSVEIARLEAQLKALTAQHEDLVQEQQSLNTALSVSDAERAALNERLEQQAAEFAKDKATFQKNLNEHKDRLVTMSDDSRQANQARRDAEKEAVAAREQASSIERENQSLTREVADARDEVRLLTEQLGEVRGRLETVQHTSATQLADRDTQNAALREALDQAQARVRQYADLDRSLVQELIDERKSAGG